MSQSTDEKLALLILNWNGRANTLECLSSVAQMDPQPAFTIVVDNGSKDDSVQAVREAFPHLILIETGKNLGFAEGNNVGIRHALELGATHILLLNNDTVVDTKLGEALLNSFREDPELGIAGARLYHYVERGRIDHLGGRWNPAIRAFDLIGKGEEDALVPLDPPLDFVVGAGLCIRSDLVKKHGMLDARFFLYFEDVDLCFRIKRAGYRVKSCSQAKIWHKGAASVCGGKAHSGYFYWRNIFLFQELHFPLSSLLTSLLKTLVKEQRRALFKLLRYRFLRGKPIEEWRWISAHLRGFSDYLLRRFGDGPSWIYGPSALKKIENRDTVSNGQS